MEPYLCHVCGDEIPPPGDSADGYCDLCMALLMHDMEADERERCGT